MSRQVEIFSSSKRNADFCCLRSAVPRPASVHGLNSVLRPLWKDSDKRQNSVLGKADPNPSGGVPAKDSRMPTGCAKSMKTIQNDYKDETDIPGYLI